MTGTPERIFNFKIQHRSGTRYGNANALSRRPCRRWGCCLPEVEPKDSARAVDASRSHVENSDGALSSSTFGVESAPVTSTSVLLEIAAAIKPDTSGWTDAMEGSDALVSDDVKPVFIAATERTPCAKRRCCRKKARAVNVSPKDAADKTATTAESAVDGSTRFLVEMADLASEELKV